jgi:hypothetical protein
LVLTDIAALTEALVRRGLPARVVADRVEVAVNLRGAPHRLLLLWDDGAPLVHIVVPLDVAPGPGGHAAMARAVAWANHGLRLPGLGYDEAQGLVYFRWVAPRAEAGLVDGELDRGLITALETAADLLGPLREVSAGALPPDGVLDRAAALRVEA